MLQAVEKTIAEAIEMGFNVASTGVKNSFFCLVERASTDMTHHGLVDEVIHTRFERC